MLDFSHIPSQQQSTTIFYAQSGSWQTFVKPRNAKFIEIFCLGGGGGGGHCSINAAGSAGAGGGGAGGIVRGIIPAFLLPDTLYIQVGKGGPGGKISGGAGTNGGISYVALQPSGSEQTLICKSSTLTAGGGLAAGTGGNAATTSTITLSAFGNLGLFTAIAGVIGSAGGANTGAPGSNQTALASGLVTGGAGGGGKTASAETSGGRIAPAPVILTSAVGGGFLNPGDSGNSGYGTLQPFCGAGGAGGGSIMTGIGGKGGNGYYGCGGGGGGGASITGGFGGDGGDGLVIITVIS